MTTSWLFLFILVVIPKILEELQHFISFFVLLVSSCDIHFDSCPCLQPSRYWNVRWELYRGILNCDPFSLISSFPVEPHSKCPQSTHPKMEVLEWPPSLVLPNLRLQKGAIASFQTHHLLSTLASGAPQTHLVNGCLSGHSHHPWSLHLRQCYQFHQISCWS